MIRYFRFEHPAAYSRNQPRRVLCISPNSSRVVIKFQQPFESVKMSEQNRIGLAQGLLALSPLFLFLALYLGVSIVVGDFYKLPITVAFLISAVYAVSIFKGSIESRIQTFSKGAGSHNVLLMVWIYLLSGAFASSAKAVGAVDATVNLTLDLLPSSLLLPGVFLAACVVSLAVGTSVGTIAALTPVAVGIAVQSGASIPLMVAIVIGGAFFGDNLSFISDTTIAATQTQGCKMADKFKTNFKIVLPVALLTLVLYAYLGKDVAVVQAHDAYDVWRVIPYAAVIITALAGVNVMVVLLIGLVLCGAIGLLSGSFGIFEWISTVSSGLMSMGDLIIMAILAAGTMEIIRCMGGVDFIIECLSRNVKSKRSGEFAIAGLVGLTDLCTANNTVSIVTTGTIANDISKRFGIDPRRTASVLDTTSCCIQGLIPYSAQLIVATGLVMSTASVKMSPMEVIPYLFYPMGIGVAVLISIISQYPRYSEESSREAVGSAEPQPS